MRGNCPIIDVTGSKSIMLRVLSIAGFGDRPIRIENASDCEDVREMLEALRVLGVRYRFDNGRLEIEPVAEFSQDRVQLRFNGSATALRILVARLAVMEGVYVEIELSRELARRPHAELLDAFHGVNLLDDGKTIEIVGRRKKRLRLHTEGTVSSQYVTAMMLAAPCTDEGFELRIPESQVSLPYIHMTARIMRDFGADVFIDGETIRVMGNQAYRCPDRYTIEPDASTAAFWLVASLIAGREVVVRYPDPHSVQGDARFLDVLMRMGVEIERYEGGVSVRARDTRGIEVDMRDMPDCVPPLVALALCADSTTRIRGVGHLRWKESDRIERTVTQAGRIGGRIDYGDERLIVHPLDRQPEPVVVETGSDHRIAMMFAVLALRYPQIDIDDRVCVEKSCRSFWLKIRKIGG